MSIDDLISQPVQPATIRVGEIARDTPDVETGATVIIPSFHDQRDFGPAPWPSRVDEDGNPLLPLKGDLALVVFDDEDRTWIVNWWPYAE